MGLFQMREIEKRLEAGEPESELAALRARVAELEVVLRAAIAANPDDIAALILEPIQSEGGDNHFRAEYLKALRQICDEHESS